MSQTIQLPKRFLKAIESKPEYGNLANALRNASVIYYDNRMFFFEEYTNHGLDHINDVLSSSDDIIPTNSLKAFSPTNIVYYIYSVILHDIGMQLSLEGFKKLINGVLDDFMIKEFDIKTWKMEWEEFLLKASKYDEKSIRNIFGEDIPVDFVVPKPDIDSLTGNNIGGYDRKLIGEFIRLNHARLAHEVAIGGFPGEENTDLLLGVESEIRNIIGLIARSHNLNVRSTFAYLKKLEPKFWYSIHKIPVVYLMILLRLSDLIQIHAGRADKKILKYRRLYNSVSAKEWALHHSISYIYTSEENDDPESIYITTTPKTSEIFLKARKLLDYIQYELDLSWAILGEVYAKHVSYKNLVIKYRRINSNIDDIDSFKNTVSYIPKRIIFDTTRELQKLLIAPLYGNNPSYGIRELLQNAVDACRTRAYFCNQHNITYTPEIELSIIHDSASEKYKFSIRDNGIGMTLDTVTNYFLKAGASFRKSYAWQKDYVNEEGNTNVQRTGRFGVGVLAVFLLGEKIAVTTNNISESSQALFFEATLDSDQIEVNKVKAEIGTLIEVVLSEHALEIIKEQFSTFEGGFGKNYAPWNQWYKLSDPPLTIRTPEEWETRYLSPKILGLNDKLTPSAYSIKPVGFNKVIWSYFNGAINLTCNGFSIPGGYRVRRFDYQTITTLPNVSVFDYDANLPLTLNRNYLEDDKLPFEEILMEKVYEDILAYALSLKIDKANPNGYKVHGGLLEHPALQESMRYSNYDKVAYVVNRLVFGLNSFTFSLPMCFEKSGYNKLLQLWPSRNNEAKFLPALNKKIALIYYEPGIIEIARAESENQGGQERFKSIVDAIGEEIDSLYERRRRRTDDFAMMQNNFAFDSRVIGFAHKDI